MDKKSNLSQNQPSQRDMSTEHSFVHSTPSSPQSQSPGNVYNSGRTVVYNQSGYVNLVVSPSSSDHDDPVSFGGSTSGSRIPEDDEQSHHDNLQSVPNRNK
ncbi:hypothetical protein OGATHE_002145 [Ogataea polymorpha]|uniref:Uncharacterized protein n=1 Tax=Ogataea polymorpha TaxID=460523 RepID=A0A9P8TCI8_9ASCO|nr:hypothetical protein OGATHE_002145 [Ogataea polymorpha]